MRPRIGFTAATTTRWDVLHQNHAAADKWFAPRKPPFAGVMIVRRCIQSQPGNNSERVTLARIDRDSFPRTALAVAAEFR